MFAWMVAEIGGLNLAGYPKMRKSCWKFPEFDERAVGN
jgi:hypothetical protein